MPRLRKARADDPELEEWLALAADAFDEGRYDEVHALAEKVLARQPKRVEALHFSAAAAHRGGDFHRAEEAYRKALKLAPDDPELLLGAADLAIHELGEERPHLEEALGWVTRGRKLSERLGDEDLVFEFWVLEGVARSQAGECQAALACLNQALQLQPDALDVELERGIALFELCRFEDAGRTLTRLAGRLPESPWVHHYLGLLHERRGDWKEAKRCFLAAQTLAPEQFPPPVVLSDEEFDAAVQAAVERLPGHVKQYLDNTTIAVEPLPSAEDLTAEKPPLSPSILGVFRGTPVGERSVSNPYDHFPAAIVLYQRNLERFAKTREELIEQIGITLMHEVGHLIGLDEEDLWERGLD